MDRGAVGASMRKAAKEDGGAPREAFIRSATDDEIDRAFEDTGGAVPAREQRQKSRADGGVYLEPPGGKNVRTVPDQRALENMRARAAKRQGQNPSEASAPVNSAAPTPVQAHEDWEGGPAASGASEPSAIEQAMERALVVQAGQGMLERACARALTALVHLPRGIELYVGPNLGQEAVELVMGLGILIGQGMATLRDGGGWSATEKGRKQ